jgi:hypothetical protein
VEILFFGSTHLSAYNIAADGGVYLSRSWPWFIGTKWSNFIGAGLIFI